LLRGHEATTDRRERTGVPSGLGSPFGLRGLNARVRSFADVAALVRKKQHSSGQCRLTLINAQDA
jgi:hypothetical protein